MQPNKLELLEELNKRGIEPGGFEGFGTGASLSGYDKSAILAELNKRGVSPEQINPPTGEIISQEYPIRRQISNVVRPTLQLGLGTAASVATAPGGPLAQVAGFGLAFSMGTNIADRLDEFLGLTKSMDFKQSSIKALEDIEHGAMLEMGGGVLGKGLTLAGKGIWAIADKVGLLNFFKAIKGMFPTMSDQGILNKAGEILRETRAQDAVTKKTGAETGEVFKRAGIKTKPTFGQATGSQQAAGYEQSVASKNRQLMAILKQQDDQIKKEALAGVDGRFTEGQPGDFVKSIETVKGELDQAAQKAVQVVEQNVAQLRNVKDPKLVGEATEAALRTARDIEKVAIDNIYNQIPQGIELSSIPIGKVLAEVRKDYLKIGGGPGTFPTAIIKQMKSALKGDKGRSVTLEKLRDWRSQLSQEISDSYSGINPNLKLIRRLKKLQNGVDKAMDQMLTLSDDFASTIELYRTASSRFSKYADTFRKGTVGEVLHQGRLRGGRKVAVEDIPTRFFNDGKVTAAQDLISAVGAADAKLLIDDYVGLNLLATARGGNIINSAAARQWLAKNRTVLKEFGLFDKYAAMVKSGEIADDLLLSANQYNVDIANRVLGVNVNDVIPNIFGGAQAKRGAQVAKDLLAIPGVKENPASLEGIKVGFKKYFFDSIQTNQGQSISAARKFLEKHGSAMEVIYKDSPGQFQALKDYHKVLEILDRNKNVSFALGSTTAEKLSMSRQESISTIFTNVAQLAAIQRGKGFFFGALRNIWKTIVNKPTEFSEIQIEGLLQEAIYNPSVAKAIMEASKPYRAKAVQNKLKKHLITMGLYAVEQPTGATQ